MSEIVTTDSSGGGGWLNADEELFLENTLKDPKLHQYLFTNHDVRLRYPHNMQKSYSEFAASSVEEFQKARQTLRRIMNKSPYIIGGNQQAYITMQDKDILGEDLEIGRRVTFGYRLLLMKPKYDIGKHMSLIELVFTVPVKVLPVNNGEFFIMDEDHVFVISGFDRLILKSHPSHGGVTFHVDLYRMVTTGDIIVSSTEDDKRIHVMLDKDEKPNVVIAKQNFSTSPEESPAVYLMNKAHGDEKKEIVEKDFESFKRKLGSLNTRFSKETLVALFRISTRNKSIITKLLFDVHTHMLKLSHVISSFSTSRPQDTRYSELESKIFAIVSSITKELDTYFKDESSLTSSATTFYTTISSKHTEKISGGVGSFVAFDNYIVCYNSTDSIIDVVEKKPEYVILALHVPPRMPILMLPEHTGKSKYHMAIVLPRGSVFQLEKVDSIKVSETPVVTFRKLFDMRYNRQSIMIPSEERTDHLLQIEPDMLSSIARDETF